MNAKTLKNLLRIGGASGAFVALTALQSLLLGKILSVEMFGITRTVTAYMILLSMLGHATLHNALAYYAVNSRGKGDLSAYVFHATLLISLISTLIGSIAVIYIGFSGHWEGEQKFALIAVILSLPLATLTIAYNACLEAIGDYKVYARVIFLSGLVPLLLITAASIFWSIDGWIVGRIVSTLLLLIISAYTIKQYLVKTAPQWLYAGNLLSFAKIQIVSGLLSLALLSADIIILDRLTQDLTIVANYGMALLFANACVFIPTALGRVYFKDMADTGPNGKRKRREYLFLTLITAMIVTAALYFIGPLFIELLFGNGYALAANILKIMALGMVFRFLWNSLSVINVSTGNPRRAVAISMVGSIIGIALLITLIPLEQGAGAAWAMNAAYAGGALLGLLLLWLPNTKAGDTHAH